MENKGVTLIELMLAVVLIITVVISIALFLPKATQSAIVNKELTVAKNLASSRIEELKLGGYDQLTTTPAAFFSANQKPTCNCSAELLPPDVAVPADPNSITAIPPDVVDTEDGISYTRYICVNQITRVGNAWQPACYDKTNSATDTGLRHIRVRVVWHRRHAAPESGTAGVGGDSTLIYNAESVISR